MKVTPNRQVFTDESSSDDRSPTRLLVPPVEEETGQSVVFPLLPVEIDAGANLPVAFGRGPVTSPEAGRVRAGKLLDARLDLRGLQGVRLRVVHLGEATADPIVGAVRGETRVGAATRGAGCAFATTPVAEKSRKAIMRERILLQISGLFLYDNRLGRG